jgi:hypothetical protein
MGYRIIAGLAGLYEHDRKARFSAMLEARLYGRDAALRLVALMLRTRGTH